MATTFIGHRVAMPGDNLVAVAAATLELPSTGASEGDEIFCAATVDPAYLVFQGVADPGRQARINPGRRLRFSFHNGSWHVKVAGEDTTEIEGLCMFMPFGAKLTRLHLRFRVNNTEITGLELFVRMRQQARVAPPGTPQSIGGASHSEHTLLSTVLPTQTWAYGHEFDLDHTIPDDSLATLDLCIRPQGTLTSSRQVYLSGAFEYTGIL